MTDGSIDKSTLRKGIVQDAVQQNKTGIQTAVTCERCGGTIPRPSVETEKGYFHKPCWRRWVTSELVEE